MALSHCLNMVLKWFANRSIARTTIQASEMVSNAEEIGIRLKLPDLFNDSKEGHCHRLARFQHLLMKQRKAFCICPRVSIYARTDVYRF